MTPVKHQFHVRQQLWEHSAAADPWGCALRVWVSQLTLLTCTHGSAVTSRVKGFQSLAESSG